MDGNSLQQTDGTKFEPGKMRGARPTPRHKLASATPFRPAGRAPASASWVPKQLSMWGNSQYGDCVSAEEAFAKACNNPEIFVPESTVIQWARQHGFLNGADLSEVMDAMQKDGMVVSGTKYDDGPYQSVDYTNEPTLQAAIALGPVKIGIDADALPSGAGNSNGWYTLASGNYRNEDHCVSLCGYGQAVELFAALGVPVPMGLQPSQPGYLLFTWSTIGFVTHGWILGTVGEAWIRNPTTVIDGPTPVPPPPPPTPTPTPTPGGVAQVVVQQPLLPGTYPIGPAIGGQPTEPKAIPWQLLIQILIAILNGLVPVVPPASSSAEPTRQSA